MIQGKEEQQHSEEMEREMWEWVPVLYPFDQDEETVKV